MVFIRKLIQIINKYYESWYVIRKITQIINKYQEKNYLSDTSGNGEYSEKFP